MKITKRQFTGAALAAAGSSLAMLAFGASGAAAAEKRREEHHTHMHHAIEELKEARHELKESAHDFGGHREEALKAVDHAIDQLEIALKHDKR